MTAQVWVQLAEDASAHRVVWGPFTDDTAAKRFCLFVTDEIDPAEVVPSAPGGGPPPGHVVIDPVHELLAWRDQWQLMEAIHGPGMSDAQVTATTPDGQPVL